MTVYDCCMFLNENDVYEIRLNEQWDFVDKFIVLEAGQTHTGLPKPYQFDRKRFEPYSSKLVYLQMDSIDEAMRLHPQFVDHPVANALPSYYDKESWLKDHFQFDYLVRILQEQGAKDNDIINISCTDEIIKPTAFQEALRVINSHPPVISWGAELLPVIAYKLDFYCYKINLKANRPRFIGGMTTPFANFHKLLPSRLRHLVLFTYPPIKNAGWHFSFIDNTDGDLVLQKYKSWAHAKDLDGGEIRFNYEDKLRAVKRVFDDYQLKEIDMTESSHPKFVLENLDRFNNIIYS